MTQLRSRHRSDVAHLLAIRATLLLLFVAIVAAPVEAVLAPCAAPAGDSVSFHREGDRIVFSGQIWKRCGCQYRDMAVRWDGGSSAVVLPAR